MFYKLAVMILLLSNVTAHAQTNLPPGFVTTTKPVICGPLNAVFRGLADTELNERPIWIGTDDNNTNYTIFVNPNTGAFTIVQFSEQIACILGLGSASELFLPNIQKGKPM